MARSTGGVWRAVVSSPIATAAPSSSPEEAFHAEAGSLPECRVDSCQQESSRIRDFFSRRFFRRKRIRATPTPICATRSGTSADRRQCVRVARLSVGTSVTSSQGTGAVATTIGRRVGIGLCSGPYDLLNRLERCQPIPTNLDDDARVVTNDDAHGALGGHTQHLRYFWKCQAVPSHQPLDHVRCRLAKGVVQRRAKTQGHQVSWGFDTGR